ncbi:hypothetical protein E3N88_39696 [Mikania micrantha]|uniref:Uncharacterized protein n=1 Tax=Mikania micrantha TaxID=192012 RepID=A0A5N6LKI6_9ASTR|nr:hypothetical protein E3N88_39696 [Mikania micrantha]
MAAAAPPPPPTATAELNMNLPTNYPLFTRIRLAGKPDVSAIHKMIHQMAVFERLSDQCSATEPSLSATLFSNNTPFESVTVFLIEVSTTPFPSSVSHHPKFTPIHMTLNLDCPISDPDMETFKSSKTEDAIIIAVLPEEGVGEDDVVGGGETGSGDGVREGGVGCVGLEYECD